MKPFSVDLIEDNLTFYFTIDSTDRKEYIFKKKTGVLKRTYDTDWVSTAIELNSLSDASSHISKGLRIGGLKNRTRGITFNPGQLLRDNEFIVNSLRDYDLLEWKVIFRLNDSKKIILNQEKGEQTSSFNYFSILIKFRLKGNHNYIEVGEGAPVQHLKINQSGLSSRVGDIVKNHKNCKDIDFKREIPVVLNAGDGGIVFHEILGHSLETDHVYQQLSPVSLSDLGKTVVSKNVGLVTDDKKDEFFKGITCDDEGFVPESSVLIEGGVLRNLISDYFYNDLLNIKNCGHSRLEDFTKIPMPRMHALYLKPGNFHRDELIKSTRYGVYAKEFGEGKVFFDKNLFYFNIKESYLIEDGKISFPLGSIVVRGNIIDVLNSVDMIANDFRYDKGVSYCFKNGQTINVRVGQPTIKIKNLFVTKDIND